VNKMKSLSSGWAHRTVPELQDFTWQAGYGAFSVSRSRVRRVAAYIRNQEAHHRTRTFEEEFVEFLKRHGVAYDPHHVWD
jgi:putative transposase